MNDADVLIIGGGLAGLYSALCLDPRLSCVIAAKEDVQTSNSWMAQGGIAAAVAHDDQPLFHMNDTLSAGAGLCDERAVQVLVSEGPADIKALRDMNVPFDSNAEGELHITREGGHTRCRVIHAGGDATGRETVKVLARIASARDNITLLPGCFLTELLLDANGRCRGAMLYDSTHRVFKARAVILATGGIGQIYKRTTNPPGATGEGIAIAHRAGAAVSGMEFIQFHPTALFRHDSSSAFLITEAVRGEGGKLLNNSGEQFTDELAPRDVVARAILYEMRRTGHPCVYLDITGKHALEQRFPTITAECARHGIDIFKQPIPVSPAQHYLMGGVTTDLYAQSTVPGLYVCGEAANSGVHGANRLASNSMLECLVFGRRAARHICESSDVLNSEPLIPKNPSAPDNDSHMEIKEICEKYAGVARTSAGLQTGLSELEKLPQSNMRGLAELVFRAAIARKESVGAHYLESGNGEQVWNCV